MNVKIPQNRAHLKLVGMRGPSHFYILKIFVKIKENVEILRSHNSEGFFTNNLGLKKALWRDIYPIILLFFEPHDTVTPNNTKILMSYFPLAFPWNSVL